MTQPILWPGHPWVAPLPACNEHLLRDFGGMNLALAVVLGVAAATLDRRLATTALVAYLVFALPHLVFHLNHLEPVRDRRRDRPTRRPGDAGGAAPYPARPRPPSSRSRRP